ncbi:MAG: hypothetical protein AB1758_02930 [Candidatus Eremiobacterota bacterium]
MQTNATQNANSYTTTGLPQRIERNRPEADATPQDLFKSAASPKEPTQSVLVSYLPQDEGMLPPDLAEVEARHTPTGPANDRFQVSVPRNFPVARPDSGGDLVFDTDDPRFDSAHSFLMADRSLKMAQEYLGRDLPWSFTQELGREQLLIHPHAGADTANAFYHSEAGSVNFFHYKDDDGELHRTGASADIVAHETGHAILDALRHNYISSLTVAAGGFHESFGDMVSILVALKDPAVVGALHEETQGNLALPNLVSRLAENLGRSAGAMDGTETDCLRQALNNHKYVDQHFLPYIDAKDPFSGMGQEPHAYSNLFTGAFYEILFGLHDAVGSEASVPFAEAISGARDIAGSLLFRGMEFAPVGEPTYREVALAMLKADQVDFGGQLRPLLEQVFTRRKILSEDDLRAFDAREEKLPELQMEPSVTQKEGAMAFLNAHREKLQLSENLPFEFVSSHVTNRGETFVLYKYHQDISLEGQDYGIMEGARARMNGGLVLAFDAEGKLFAANHDDITEREIEDVKDHLKTALGAGMLSAQGIQPGSGNSACRPGQPCSHGKFASNYMQLNVIGEGAGRVLRRAPMLTC